MAKTDKRAGKPAAAEEKRAALEVDKKSGADAEDPDEYRADNIFWVPKEARWPHLQGKAKQPTIGKLVDDAMVAIERDNPTLEGVLPKDFARPALDKQRLGELIDLIGTIGLGDRQNRSADSPDKRSRVRREGLITNVPSTRPPLVRPETNPNPPLHATRWTRRRPRTVA